MIGINDGRRIADSVLDLVFLRLRVELARLKLRQNTKPGQCLSREAGQTPENRYAYESICHKVLVSLSILFGCQRITAAERTQSVFAASPSMHRR